MTRKSIILILISATLFGACKVSKNIKVSEPIQKVILNELEIRPGASQMKSPYRETAARTADMIHMNLAVSFNYEKQHVLGKWIGTFTAYSYPINTLKLDAKQFILHRVALIKKSDTLNLAYNYDNEEISIKLNKYYGKKDTFFIYIVYTARPEEIVSEGSAAITDAKGLYFINPTGKTPGKPRQIWTQGETQSNSGWFPVIDLPNEKITQEIAVTVDDKDLTISNGELYPACRR
jgi:aminopeptidase N